MKIRWSPAATALAARYMHDQVGMRAIGAAVAALAGDPLPARGIPPGQVSPVARRPVPGHVFHRR